ncbi:1859_t:CDS:2, partial [Gigaspora rosea]
AIQVDRREIWHGTWFKGRTYTENKQNNIEFISGKDHAARTLSRAFIDISEGLWNIYRNNTQFTTEIKVIELLTSRLHRQPEAVIEADILPKAMKIKNKTWPTRIPAYISEDIVGEDLAPYHLSLGIAQNNKELKYDVIIDPGLHGVEESNTKIVTEFEPTFSATQLRYSTLSSHTNEQYKEGNLDTQPRRIEKTG